MSTVAFTLKDANDTDYVKILHELVRINTKPGDRFNVSEYVRKMILKEAKKAGIL